MRPKNGGLGRRAPVGIAAGASKPAQERPTARSESTSSRSRMVVIVALSLIVLSGLYSAFNLANIPEGGRAGLVGTVQVPQTIDETLLPVVSETGEEDEPREADDNPPAETEDKDDEAPSGFQERTETHIEESSTSATPTANLRDEISKEDPSWDSSKEDAIPQKPEETDDEEQFEVPFDIRPVHRNGCPFGWHSPSLKSPNCYHVSLIPLSADEANGKCSEMGSKHGMRAYLARVHSLDVNSLLCDILNRGNNRFLHPDRLHIGLIESSRSNTSLAWRDGKGFAQSFNAFSTGVPPKDLDGKTVALVCNGKNYLKWNVESDTAIPYACSGPKLKYGTMKSDEFVPEDPIERRELDEDSFLFEQGDLESVAWVKPAPWDVHTVKECRKLGEELDERRVHQNAILARLETQIFWKLTEHRSSKTEPRRYYMVWQSKSWFGWLDFWVEYLSKYRDFKGAPVGKFVTSSRAAKERLGYSSIFANPALALKYEGALVVLSRLPIPDNVVAYFPPGTLVNQLYMDPFARVPLGDKLELAQYLTRFAEDQECSTVGDLKIIPQTFDASNERGCLLAVKTMQQEKDKTETEWVIKGPQHGGAAITLATPEQVLERLSPCNSAVLERHELVQKLITKPLLLDGRKFDLRVFVLVTSTKPLIAYIHREPYYRATIRKFSTTGSASDKSRHVTNTHIQKVARYNFTDKDWADHLWTPDKVKLYASRAGVQTDFWPEIVFPKIKCAVQAVFRATAMSLRDRRPGQWKLFGVDFVIDENLHPYLLDWNAFPGWDWSYRLSWTLEYRRRILGDAWRLLLDIQRGQAIAESRATPKSGGFELIYHTVK